MSTNKKRISIVIVDDHEMVRIGLRSMLADANIEVTGEAESGAEALDKVKALQPDVILMDINMPGMDGIEAVAQITADWPDARIMMMTTYRNTDYLRRSLAAGAVGFVFKDIPSDDLIDHIRAVAGGATRFDREFLQMVMRSESMVAELSTALTPREKDVLGLLTTGMTNQAIAETLQLSPATVKGYLKTLFQKLDVADRTQAAVKAIRLGLVR